MTSIAAGRDSQKLIPALVIMAQYKLDSEEGGVTTSSIGLRGRCDVELRASSENIAMLVYNYHIIPPSLYIIALAYQTGSDKQEQNQDDKCNGVLGNECRL